MAELELVGDRTTTTAPARELSLAMHGQKPAAAESILQSGFELEFDGMANLEAQDGNNQKMHSAGTDAKPIIEPEFDQTLGF